MKQLYIICIFTAVLLVSSCSDEKDFFLDGHATQIVNFSAINLSIGDMDSAISSREPGYGEPRDNYHFSFDAFLPGGNSIVESPEIRLDYINQIWVGAYSRLEFNFIPSCPEEKELILTMPDSTSYTLTAVNPKLIWEFTPEVFRKSLDLYGWDYLLIKGQSTYTQNHTTYHGIGYINLVVGRRYQFNSQDKKWYYNDWLSNPNLVVSSVVNFSVENLSVGSEDFATSSQNAYYYPQTGGRDTKLTIPLIRLYNNYNDSIPRDYKISLNYYDQLWAGGNNELKVTFHPKPGENSATFTMPDGKQFVKTRSDSTFTWSFTNEIMQNVSYNYYGTPISATSKYEFNGIQYENTGYTLLLYQRNPYVWFSPSSGKWYMDYSVSDK